jgi:phosphatidylglycerophosphatase A
MNNPLSPLGDALLTTFGLGRCRPASGTWGSLPPVAVGALLLAFGLPVEGLAFGLVMIAIAGLSAGACIRFGDEAVARWGRPDPSQVVADETAGMAIVLAFLPVGAASTPALAAVTLALAFIAFRALDILKPFPADRLEALPGGWGILADDLAAAVYAVLVMHLAALAL